MKQIPFELTHLFDDVDCDGEAQERFVELIARRHKDHVAAITSAWEFERHLEHYFTTAQMDWLVVDHFGSTATPKSVRIRRLLN